MNQQHPIIEQYQTHLTEAGKSEHTVRAYGHDLASFIRWWEQTTGDRFQPKVVVHRDILDYRSFLQQRGRAPATINRRLNGLRKFFQWTRRQQLTPDSPFDLIETIFVKQQNDTAPAWLDPNQQLALIRAIRKKESKRDLAIIRTFLGAGLRISELAGLTVEDVKISDRKGSLTVTGKGMKQRTIPLNKQTRAALTAYLEERPDHPSQRLFIGQRGPLTERGINQLVTKYAYQARLEQCTAHTLRHSFAKNLVDTGTPLDQVAVLLGHETLETTKIYTRPSQQDLERAVHRAAGEVEEGI